MNLVPPRQQTVALLRDDRHGAPDIGAGHVHLGFAAFEHMNVGRLVIVCEDHDAEPGRAMNRDRV